MDKIDQHNGVQVDRISQTLVGLLARAVTEKPHGSLTIRAEWRGHILTRLVTIEEASQLLVAAPRDDN